MATGQSLLNLCEDLYPELQLQAGESDVSKGLRVLNAAQDVLESLLARHPTAMGDSIGTVTTTNNTESTAFPAGLLRLDKLQFIDATTSRPAWDLHNLRQTGAHAFRSYWPYDVISTSTTGKPRNYWTNGRNIYWDPLPNGTHTVRWYGLSALADITAAGTFGYPDAVMLPLAAVAVRVLKGGLDDSDKDVSTLAQDVLDPVVTFLAGFNRDGPIPFEYRYVHST